MATRKSRTRRTTARRRARKSPATPPSRIRRLAAAPVTWVRRPARLALTASLMGLVVAEAAWNARPGSWRKSAR